MWPGALSRALRGDQVTGGWVIATVGGALIGGVITQAMTSVGLRQVDSRPRPRLAAGSAIAGAVISTVAMWIAYRADESVIAPALLIWGCGLVAAAACDAVTRRIPTALVRQAIVVTAALLVVGLGLQGHWRALSLSGVAAVAAGATMLACWRFAGAGFGDVRLATLGGLGLGHATERGLLIGFLALVLAVAIQAWTVVARDGDRHTQTALGPSLTIGFLMAATF